MSKEWQETIKLIRDLASNIDPDEEYLTIVSAEEQIAASEAKRKQELEEAYANLKALSKTLEAARISSTRPTTVPSAEAHAATMNQLDGARLSLIKAISTAESDLASKEAERATLKEEIRQLEECNPALEHEKELDSTTLRIQMFRGLGFEAVMEDGNATKMLVRAQSGDVHSVEFNQGKSDYEYTQMLWKLVSS